MPLVVLVVARCRRGAISGTSFAGRSYQSYPAAHVSWIGPTIGGRVCTITGCTLRHGTLADNDMVDARRFSIPRFFHLPCGRIRFDSSSHVHPGALFAFKLRVDSSMAYGFSRPMYRHKENPWNA